jgi:membrane fusion protein (multidrug efflux system)
MSSLTETQPERPRPAGAPGRTTASSRETPARESVARGARDGEPSSSAVAPVVDAASTTSPAPKQKRSPVVLIVVGVVVLAFATLGAQRYVFGLSHVTTDNAQVEGHIVPVIPKVGGYVAEVRVVGDQQVKAGDVLVTLDDRDLRARLAQADADLVKETANAGTRGVTGQTQAQLAAARANVVQAEATAARAASDLERYRRLAAGGTVSRQSLEAAETAERTTRAVLDAARGQAAAAVAAVTGADARVASARAARDQAALQLSYAIITAPNAGIVSKKNVEVGQLVQPGQPLMTVVPLQDVWVVANLKETEIKDVTPGDPAIIRVDAYPGRKVSGRVLSLGAATGARFSLLPPDNATGNFTKVVQRIPVRIAVEGGPDAAHPLRPGMSVNVEIKTR